jgi:hypothetical protein
VVILHTILDETKDADEKSVLGAVQKMIATHSGMLAKFVSTPDDQVELVWALQDYSNDPKHEKYKKIFPFVLHALYNHEIVEEDAIWKWVEEQEQEDQTYVKLVPYTINHSLPNHNRVKLS